MKDLLKYQVKSITPVDHYICNLSKELRTIAETRLGETPEKVENCIKEIRDWVLKNPRIIKTRLDSNFILRTLRHTKFNLEKSKEWIERFTLIHYMVVENDWSFEGFDFKTNQSLREFVKEKFIVILPKNDKNLPNAMLCKLLCSERYDKDYFKTFITVNMLINECLMDEEENQIKGIHNIQDYGSFSLRLALSMPLSYWISLSKINQKWSSTSFISNYIMNLPFAISFLKNIFYAVLTEKMKKRVHFVSKSSKLQQLPEMQSYEFPHEYGGNLDYEKLTDKMVKMIDDKMDSLQCYKNIKINRDLYPENVLKFKTDSFANYLEDICEKYQRK